MRLPATTDQFGRFAILVRIAKAQQGDKTPTGRDVEQAIDGRGIKNRHPAKPDPACPGRQPQNMDRGDHRPAKRFGHRRAAKTMAGAGALVAEHRQHFVLS